MRHASLFSLHDELFQMLDVTVHTAITHEPQQMKLAGAGLGSMEGFLQHGIGT